ncbi:winged helix-turn-helix domain-containing protein [Aeromicrobium wangtongii]|uniref:Winged helix DNA-binding domain-containing protein n=1 Tax=Aeromicrobium wangtongii TaxID=2969247 RepID=A0ABY5MFF2_9ACTN|nr:crosslink repair DNA glycosylase YcaQ family protein [Aeromicrobium wangtongii]MCD9197075.1 winged helix DNA-binding domain-containing protein [Aeromicrobium wangtongii]UUP14576.1 winged helix DNA-binding domain-containing protein [Aeromicrobium wangtongii]
MTPQQLTVLQARRIALAAQGFTRPRVGLSRDVGSAHIARVIERLGFFQIDSVNVLQRAHYMPLFSRLGPYDVELLHRASGRAPRRLFEYWAHEAALVDVNLWQAFQFRMEAGARMWGGMIRIARDKPEFVEWVLDEVRANGPLTAREIEHDVPRQRDNWGWNWSEVKAALEYLFYKGQVTAARRNSAFERVYDLPERVIPRAQLEAPPLDAAEAHRELVGHAARALGVGTAQCLRDYFRLQPGPTKAAIEDLLETGELLPATIAGWNRPAYLHRDAVLSRKVQARALLSPFDPLVFERTRAERLFGFRYRIEIYVPADQRVHGYYVLPFLLGDRLVARVDLKADRQAGVLVVHGAWAEDHAPAHTAGELAAELRLMADWLGLGSVAPPAKGDLAGELTRALASVLD